jgi:hypothetical protein
MHADRKNAENLKLLLDRYCASSGQRVSDAKLNLVYFSARINIVTGSLNDKHLGLPAMIGIDRSDCFRHLIDRVQRVGRRSY